VAEDYEASPFKLPLFDAMGRRFLRRLAAQLRDGTDEDDLAQEVYLRLLRAESSRFARDPRRYAIRVARNVAVEWGRLARHRRPHLELDVLDAKAAPDPSPEAHVELDQQLGHMTDALGRLSPARRAAVLMRMRDGLSYAEIAEAMDLSISMVYKHLRLGLAACQQQLESKGVTGVAIHGTASPKEQAEK
jgi:RNA polymerase sigma-70 factor (ECF subfamily)